MGASGKFLKGGGMLTMEESRKERNWGLQEIIVGA